MSFSHGGKCEIDDMCWDIPGTSALMCNCGLKAFLQIGYNFDGCCYLTVTIFPAALCSHLRVKERAFGLVTNPFRIQNAFFRDRISLQPMVAWDVPSATCGLNGGVCMRCIWIAVLWWTSIFDQTLGYPGEGPRWSKH